MESGRRSFRFSAELESRSALSAKKEMRKKNKSSERSLRKPIASPSCHWSSKTAASSGPERLNLLSKNLDWKTMDMDQQTWSFIRALVAFFLPLVIYFISKKSSRISKRSESPAEQQQQQPSLRLESVPEQQQQQLSSPSSSSSALPVEYEVFMSFRGPDVRTNFADFLYRDLVHSNIRTFLDDEELRKGEEIDPSLIKAIQQSKVYIPILSLDYASSKWCLKELALMVKCCKQNDGHILLPIFYMMEPRDVRHHESSYKKAFQRHSKKYGTETVKEWKEALEEVGKLKGWHVTESDRQGAVVDQLFAEVWSHLSRDYILATDDLIGIDSHVENMKRLLQSDYECVKVIGIHGMGGLGKTTIDKALYNEVYAQFDRHCFLEDERETLLQSNGIASLHKRIISSILRIDPEVQDANEGINIIKNRVCNYKVLIVLDDVDDRLKFEKILGQLKDFRLGSRFVITTRDRGVMEFFQNHELYEPEEMNEECSLQLFSRHAFGVIYPPQEEVGLSLKFVKVAAGLPLALKVIGSLLFRRDKSFWEAKLKQLKDLLPLEVQETLRISYLELSYQEKQFFCDIACFFIGEEKELPFYMWSDCGFHPEIAITTLIQRSLVKINQNYERNLFTMFEKKNRDVLWMHDHIRDLGRTIVREENFQLPWERSRVWFNKDALDMITHDKGSARLEVLKVDTLEDEFFEIKDRQFEKLSGLRYLKVRGGGLAGDFRRILSNLRWLQLVRCSYIPIDLDMNILVIFCMEYCSVTEDWIGWKRMKVAHKLKSINLYQCNKLRTVPDLSQCGNLEVIIIEYSEHMSGKLLVGNLNILKVLRVKGIDIKELPGLGQIRMLEILKIVDAPNLINLDGLELQVLLKELLLESCTIVKKLPSLSNLTKLQKLEIAYCPYLPEVDGTGVKGEPLSNLFILGRDLPELKLPDYLGSMLPLLSFLSNLGNLRFLKFKEIGGNPLLSRERVVDFSSLHSLHYLYISGCKQFTEVIGLEKLELLETLKIEDFASLRKLSNLSGLKNLKTLLITACPRLTKVTGIEKLKAVECLMIIGCTSIKKLPDLSRLKHLKTFDTTGCTQLSDVTGVI